MSPKESVKNVRVIELIKSGVEGLGVRGFAGAVKLSPAIISRYMNGNVGEPSQSTLQKLATYFTVTVAWLRGDEYSPTYLKIAELTGQDPELLQKHVDIYGDPDEEEIKKYNKQKMTELFNKLSSEEQNNVINMTKCLAAFDLEQQQRLIASVMQHYFKLHGKPLEIHETDMHNDGRYE